MDLNFDLDQLVKEKALEEEVVVSANEDALELYSDQYPFRLSLRGHHFENESEYMKFVKNCERLIRTSLEYKQWRNYIIDVLGINTCMITDERMDQVSVEVHHHLPSLYVLVKALVNKKLDQEIDFCSFDISQEVIDLHFKNKVGFLLLAITAHQKFHNGYLSIPSRLVKGDYLYFVREYSQYLDSDDLDTLNERLAVSESNCGWSRNNYPGGLTGNEIS